MRCGRGQMGVTDNIPKRLWITGIAEKHYVALSLDLFALGSIFICLYMYQYHGNLLSMLWEFLNNLLHNWFIGKSMFHFESHYAYISFYWKAKEIIGVKYAFVFHVL